MIHKNPFILGSKCQK